MLLRFWCNHRHLTWLNDLKVMKAVNCTSNKSVVLLSLDDNSSQAGTLRSYKAV